MQSYVPEKKEMSRLMQSLSTMPRRAMVQKTRVRIQILNLLLTIRVRDAVQIRSVELHEELCFGVLVANDSRIGKKARIGDSGGWE